MRAPAAGSRAWRAAAALALLATAAGCTRGDVARWRGRSMGTLVAAPGMPLDEVQRRSTLRLNSYGQDSYGSSGAYFDFELGGDPIRFPGCDLYTLDVKDGQVSRLQVNSPRETWPVLTAALGDAAARLRERGWQRRFTLADLEAWRTRSARSVGSSRTGTVAAFEWTKGETYLTFAVARRWSSIPFWRRADHAPWFWHSVHVGVLDEAHRQRLDARSAPDP